MKFLKTILMIILMAIINIVVISLLMFKLKEHNIILIYENKIDYNYRNILIFKPENTANELNKVFNSLDFFWLKKDAFIFKNCKSSKLFINRELYDNNAKKNIETLNLLENCKDFNNDLLFIKEYNSNNLINFKNEDDFLKQYLKYYYYLDKKMINLIANKYKFTNEIFKIEVKNV